MRERMMHELALAKVALDAPLLLKLEDIRGARRPFDKLKQPVLDDLRAKSRRS